MLGKNRRTRRTFTIRSHRMDVNTRFEQGLNWVCKRGKFGENVSKHSRDITRLGCWPSCGTNWLEKSWSCSIKLYIAARFKLPIVSKTVARQLTAVLSIHNVWDESHSGFFVRGTPSNLFFSETPMTYRCLLLRVSVPFWYCWILAQLLTLWITEWWHKGSDSGWVGFWGSSLDCSPSYLSDKSTGPYRSDSPALSCGLLLDTCFAYASLRSHHWLIQRCLHSYADDIQLYISFKPDNTALFWATAWLPLTGCLTSCCS